MKSIFLLISLVFSASAIAEEKPAITHGEQLHNEKCMACHTTNVYTREDRRIKTLQALSNQVDNCMKGAAKAEWTEIETSSVVDYLNQKFYKF
ncbi:MAG: hypothetical protein OEY61_12505 [Gammaproteobacteria bacterium]|nr:hypothetical protein [Gammaproteobacteria bacterium]